MREIKFRGRTSYGQWHTGSLLQSEIDVSGNALCEIHGRFATSLSISRVFVESESVGQHTGLKDKNGKEIYEGDILKCFLNGEEVGAIETVEFKQGRFILRHRDVSIYDWVTEVSDYMGEVEIVGNIYELLNKEQEDKLSVASKDAYSGEVG